MNRAGTKTDPGATPVAGHGRAGPAEREAGAALDSGDVRLVADASGLLRDFNVAGVLASADVHVARALGRLAGEEDEQLLLAAALAVRAPRLGHVCTDLTTIAGTATVERDFPVDLATLAWPAPEGWLTRLAGSPLVAVDRDSAGDAPAAGDGDTRAAGDGEAPVGAGPAARPLRLRGSLLYLDRYWAEERQVAADLQARAAQPADGLDITVLRAGLARLFDDTGTNAAGAAAAGSASSGTAPARTGSPGTAGHVQPEAQSVAAVDTAPDLQRLAAATAVLRRLTVVAGGPGTGKTTTVARILALLDEQARAAGTPLPRVALAAPTGKAAARLEEAVHDQAARLDVAPEVRARLLAVSASTLHRLLGWRPGSRSRFAHDRRNRLPHDVVVVDETSMVSLSLMARLVGAVRPDARLVLVGDPEQLASVEAGAVLGDVVGPARERLTVPAAARAALSGGEGQAVAAVEPSTGAALGDGIVVLRRTHRFHPDSAIAALAQAVQRGDGEAVMAVLRDGGGDVGWVDVDVGVDRHVVADAVGDAVGATVARPVASVGAGTVADATGNALAAVRDEVIAAGRRVSEAARAGDGRSALAAMGALRLLCAHRRGPYGVARWAGEVERWLSPEGSGLGMSPWYPGRPLLITENDHGLGLYNGDTGVVVAAGEGRVKAVFERRGQLFAVSPVLLSAVETVHAMTVHKSQGSQFDAVVVVLPDPDSPILTRELLYTAVTRAAQRLTVVGTEASVLAAASRPIARASGLRHRLWPLNILENPSRT